MLLLDGQFFAIFLNAIHINEETAIALFFAAHSKWAVRLRLLLVRSKKKPLVDLNDEQ